jgi:hypothetical protein
MNKGERDSNSSELNIFLGASDQPSRYKYVSLGKSKIHLS